MPDPLVQRKIDGTIGTITLSRADKFNALDIEMLMALHDALDSLEADKNLRVLLICGAGKGFCAGGDVDAWGNLNPADFQYEWIRVGHRVFDRLARLRVPTIAVLQGHALGGGLELAAATDFRVAEAHVKLGMPETSIGVVPGWSGTQRMVRRFGAQVMRRMVIGGEILEAKDGLELGLVDRVVDKGTGLTEAKKWAEQIATRAPLAVEAAKLMLLAAEGEDREAAIEALASGFVASTKDLRAGVAAFKNKTKPDFDRE